MKEKKERQECLVYSRVCGWLAPTSRFNPGKAQEKKDRVDFKV